VTGDVLVIGYGNVLRSDDGVGWHVADRLADDPRVLGSTLLHVHQLTPELALDVSRASLVVLVDAQHGPDPGAFVVDRVTAVDDTATTWSHHLDPSSLVGLAVELYGSAPDVYTVGVGVASLEAGDELSPAVRSALPGIVDAVADLITRPGMHVLTASGARSHA
jgi:hydrogenase maturation protease